MIADGTSECSLVNLRKIPMAFWCYRTWGGGFSTTGVEQLCMEAVELPLRKLGAQSLLSLYGINGIYLNN